MIYQKNQDDALNYDTFIYILINIFFDENQLIIVSLIPHYFQNPFDCYPFVLLFFYYYRFFILYQINSEF